jgi:hypothetical protein
VADEPGKRELERKIIERCLNCRHLKEMAGGRLVCKAKRCVKPLVRKWREDLEGLET